MPRNLDIALLRTFAAVADHRSMTAAARALHLTQGAVSQQIKRLEQLFGMSLLLRDPGNLRLTDAGKRLLSRAKRMAALNDEIWTEMTGRAFEGTVRLGAPQDLVAYCLAPVLKAYGDAHPQVEVSVLCLASPELPATLASGAIDLALVEEPAERSGGESLRIEPLVWIGARGGEAHRKTPIPISLVAENCAFRQTVLSAMDAQGRGWRGTFDGGLEATMAAVGVDLAVTAGLAPFVPPSLDILTSEDGLPSLPAFSISLHLPQRDITPAARELARHLRSSFAAPADMRASAA